MMFAGSGVDGLALDPIERWLYYAEEQSKSINKVSLDGGNPVEVVDIRSTWDGLVPIVIALDLEAK